MTWAAFNSRRWIKEGFVVLSPQWYGNDKLAPCGIDVAPLKADLLVIGGGGVPSIDPPAPPGPNTLPVGKVNGGWIGEGGVKVSIEANFAAGESVTSNVKGTASRPAAASDWPVGLNGPAVLADLFKIFMDYQTGNWLAMIGDIEKLLADLKRHGGGH